jgi:hypothetical protein
MRAHVRTTRRLRATVTTLTVAMAALLLSAPVTADAAVQKCTTPPTVFPEDQLTNGMEATGWTVLQGTQPESFGVTILGVLPDAIAPGDDLILVKAHGANIDAIGGMGPGFSGSPVYLNNKLVGSVSYGLGGDAHYGALTPGQELVDVLMNPRAHAAASATPHVRLSKADRRLVAKDARTALSSVGTTLTQIPMPLAVAGATDKRAALLQKKLAKQGIVVQPYRASSSTSSSQLSGGGNPIVPGGVFTAALSYGSVAYAGIGTVTIVCGDYVVAFGHSFLFQGAGLDGAMLDGNVVATIPAGSGGFFGGVPFKIANIGGLRGTIDQDRLNGVRGLIGKHLPLTTLTSSIENLDTGQTHTATTQVALPRYLAYIAYDHVFGSVLAALDARKGTDWITWTVNGVSQGQPFEFSITNAYTGYNALYRPGYDVYATLRSIRNAQGPARVTSVQIQGTVTQQPDYAVIHKPRTQSTTQPGFTTSSTLNVHKGDTVDVRVPVQQVSSGDVNTAVASFTIPTTVRGSGRLYVYASRGYFYSRRNQSLDQTIAALQKVPRGNDLTIYARFRGGHPIRFTIPTDWALKGYAEPVDLKLLK